MKKTTGASLVVKTLEQQKVKQVFGIPGAKIDPVFDELVDHGIPLIVCRHEQNAAFMAAAIGRITGNPGVCMTTSGPGATNLVTGLATATTEGDPVVAISGAVKRSESFKRTHQSLDTVSTMRPVSKMSVEVQDANAIPEALTQAFRVANTPRKGASFISLPNDVVAGETEDNIIKENHVYKAGPAPKEFIEKAATLIKNAKLPVMLVGEGSNEYDIVEATRSLLSNNPIPVVGTYQGAGLVPRSMADLLVGRIGLFHNQPGDILLSNADVILTIGYDPVEYDPHFWNKNGKAKIIHIDHNNAEIDYYYQPELELIGDIAQTINILANEVKPNSLVAYDVIKKLHSKYLADQKLPNYKQTNLVHPLQFVHTLRSLIGDDVTVTCDIGSHYIWMARYFEIYEPKRLLFSNGQQTLGVGLPWAIAASIVHPDEKVVSISGDGGFLFSAMELETAVRLKSNITHFVWTDGTYDMVGFQEEMKYGRTSGVEFGPIDVVKYAESFGAKGFEVSDPSQLESVMRKAMETPGPVIVNVPIDYKDNIKLGAKMQDEVLI
ncbi:acetolactate synthase AlsS [Rhizosphaericola mali]|uniref:Acetolactate synthase AlsS n=1 Tax=Rhizosphaericola mali TaxID=2545455 RepID=A0A5P2G1I0_9BACT|nr:acetolactate synthase AlsS [Rhizosphaericola mali]QES89027.1 acetolactate synthase AlsS [Rhizosphaericola mali]